MTNLVRLEVNGKKYEGWKSASIERNLEAIAASFSLGVTDTWAGQVTRWPIRQSDACAVYIGNDLVVSGFVDRVAPAFDATTRQITIEGRSRAGQLVDSSAVHKPDQWENIRLDDLAKEVAKPFGIEVEVPPGLDVGQAFKIAKVQQSETAFELLERYARQRGILLNSTAAGNLVLTRSGQDYAATALVQGKNILKASADFSDKGRHSPIIVKGQHAGTDSLAGDEAAQGNGKAIDEGMRIYKPLIVIAEGNTDSVAAQKRAEWEAIVRAGRAGRAQVTVQGWRQGNGQLWAPNMLTRIESDWLDLKTTMLISRVAFSIDNDGGMVTDLELARPDAFTPQPDVAKQKGGIFE